MVSAHLNKSSPLPDFIGKLQQGMTYTSQLMLGYWAGQLVVSMGRGLAIRVSSWATHSSCSEVRGGTAGWALWLGGPVGRVLLGGISGQAELLFMLSGQMEPLAGSAITYGWTKSLGVFPGRAVSLVGVHNLAGLWVGLHNFSWLVGVSGYCPQLGGSAAWILFRWDCYHGFVVGQGLGGALWSDRAMGCVLKFGGATVWALRSGRPLAVLHGCAKQWLGSGWKGPPAIFQS